MSADFFLDTNIFIYAFDSNAEEKASIAKALIHRAVTSGQGIVSHQVVQEFFHIALRRFEPRMTPAEAVRYLTDVFEPIFGVPASPALYKQALYIYGRYKLSWYDTLIVTAAISAKCAVLYTEDLQHGQRFGNLQVRNPFLEL